MQLFKDHLGHTPRSIDNRLFVGGVEKALRVLRAFYDQPEPQSLTDIANTTGLGRSAAQRFLYTLKTLGYLRQDQSTRRYTLSPRVLDLGYAYLRNDHLVDKAFPYLLEASKRTDGSVNLTELDDTEVIYVSRFPSRDFITADIVLGQRLPAFCTAPGRAMLAALPPEETLDIISRSDKTCRTRFTITDADEINDQLAVARTKGYAVSNQETFVGDLSIAAPVRNHVGQMVAAVNIAVPHPRWSMERAEETLPAVVIETARAISRTLGGN